MLVHLARDMYKQKKYTTNLEETNLKNADLTKANLQDSNFKNTNFNGANLRDTLIEGTELTGTSLEEAKISEMLVIAAGLTDEELLDWYHLHKNDSERKYDFKTVRKNDDLVSLRYILYSKSLVRIEEMYPDLNFLSLEPLEY